MHRLVKAATVVAGFAVAISTAAGADDARRPASLTAFGAVQSLSAYQIAAPGLVALDAPASFAPADFAALPALPSGAPAQAGFSAGSFATSLALTSRLALDAGYNTDVAQRFGNSGAVKSPLLDTASIVALANGGAYAGASWMPAASLHLQAGASLRSDRLDNFAFAPGLQSVGLPLAFDNSQSHSLLAGLSWDMSDWANIGLTAIHNDQTGSPYVNPLGNLSPSSRTHSDALDVAARVKLGDNWVTTASADLAGSLSQLDQKAQPAPVRDVRSYSIAIAKHGLFGDDALGFSFSRPTTGVLANGFDMVAASGDLPPVFIANNRFPNQTPETDLQLGYVTSFLDGAVALQTNAAYQMNYQGEAGANALSVLSRAKIKF